METIFITGAQVKKVGYVTWGITNGKAGGGGQAAEGNCSPPHGQVWLHP